MKNHEIVVEVLVGSGRNMRVLSEGPDGCFKGEKMENWR